MILVIRGFRVILAFLKPQSVLKDPPAPYNPPVQYHPLNLLLR